MKEIKVTVIGFGNVGSALVHLLINSDNYSFNINIMDPSGEVEGSILDLGHASMLKSGKLFELNNIEHFNQSEFVFHCAGVGVPMGASRLDIASQNIELTKQIFEGYKSQVDAKIIVISNPVDVISYFTFKSSGLTPEKVVGTGTLLDSARMNYYLSKTLGYKGNVDALLLGEHGQSIAMITSLSKVGGKPLTDVMNEEDIDRCLHNVKTAAHKIKMTQGSSIYGAVDCAYYIMESILEDANVVQPISVHLTNAMSEGFKTKALYMSVLSTINKEGCFPLEDVNYTSEEFESLVNCAKVIGRFL